MIPASGSDAAGTTGTPTGELDHSCAVCGHAVFLHTPVLWDGLVAQWGLSPFEASYIDAQQGTKCVRCGSNLRSIALARAITRSQGFEGPLTAFVATPNTTNGVLEINEAGTLSPLLSSLPGHRLGIFPGCDMMRLPFSGGSFDLVIHSDTLEHVPDPLMGLRECHRVLRDGGVLLYTVPVVLGRLTRGREGMPASFHGFEGCSDPGMMVHTEFGADFWMLALQAGFASVEIVTFRYPSGIATVARKR
jgi:SAM-dependent methyltransferase